MPKQNEEEQNLTIISLSFLLLELILAALDQRYPPDCQSRSSAPQCHASNRGHKRHAKFGDEGGIASSGGGKAERFSWRW